MKRVYLAIMILLLGAAGAVTALQTRTEDFPHEKHAHLFPLCIGCHEGVEAGDRNRFYPARTVCQSCHDGRDQKQVSWNGPDAYASNLKFSHPTHEAKEPLDCSSCHTREGQPRMAVVRTVPSRCFACHAHEARDHFVDARCQQCHVPLSRTAFVASRVERLPKPPNHDAPNFLERVHGDLAKSDQTQCAVCHTQERCAACHVDAKQKAEVKAFETAGPQLKLPRFTARYFLPVSHKTPEWIEQHGSAAARDIAECSACHTRESCTTCHAANAPRPVRALPRRESVTAPGVYASRRPPPTHNSPFFEKEHGTLAAASRETCMGCHTRPQCENCHNAATSGRDRAAASAVHPTARMPMKASTNVVQDTARRRTAARQRASYHAANFMERHAASSYNRNLECANCHDTAKFCRSCHEQRGMGTTGRLQAGFHDAQPLWLFNHGKPARQGMESCASCHKQTDCMQCHSALGSFRVNPHGRDFDAARVQSKNQRLCFACHLTDPLQRTQP